MKIKDGEVKIEKSPQPTTTKHRRKPNNNSSKKFKRMKNNLPNGKNATSLIKVGLTRDTTDALFKDGRDLGGRSFGKASDKSRTSLETVRNKN